MTLWPLVPWLLAAALEDGRRADPGTRLQRARGLALLAVIGGCCLGAGPVLPGLAVGLAGLGVGLRQWTLRTLGPAFTASPMPLGPIRQDGPFRWLRHPSETGLLALCAASWLLSGLTLWALPGLVLFAGCTARQVLDEERWLRSRLEVDTWTA